MAFLKHTWWAHIFIVVSVLPTQEPFADGFGKWCMEGISSLIREGAYIQYHLFDRDSLKVFTACTPAYIISRITDHHVHACFYDAAHHKNKHQLPDTVCKVLGKSGDVGIIALSSLAFFSSQEELRIIARIFGIGAASALITKDLIKQVHSQANLRPWNEKFSCTHQAQGGFPSGHMIEASYLATFWGLYGGMKVAIPAALFAGLMFGVLVNCNRHYASQVVAGAGFGIAYGIAAYKTAQFTIEQEKKDFVLDYSGSGMKVSYFF